VLYQAGSSDRGTTFAARHAELVFVTLNGMKQGQEQVAELRRRAAAFGRDPARLKVLQGMCLMVAPDSGQARARAEEYLRLSSHGALITKWCGWSGVDLATYPGDLPLSEVDNPNLHSVAGFLRRSAPDRVMTVADLRDFVAVPRRPHPYARLMLFGTPAEVADRMVEWMDRTGVDGFNLMPCPATQGLADFCELLVPELRRRGLLRTSYDPAEQTLRERYFGAGQTRYQRPEVATVEVVPGGAGPD
jgi:alkanesulfonate monooxygenase SsuD/methylene tetrahydromethanopterin reductase-like flavin-dependent oxidoreductase (luciferase family)